MDHKVSHDDSDCQKLVSTFSQFFTDKVSKIHANLASALKSSTRRQFATSPNVGPMLSPFSQVTTDEVSRLLSAMRAKSSTLDALPCDINVTYTLPKSAFNGLQFRRRQYRSISIRLAVIASKTREMLRNSKRI